MSEESCYHIWPPDIVRGIRSVHSPELLFQTCTTQPEMVRFRRVERGGRGGLIHIKMDDESPLHIWCQRLHSSESVFGSCPIW